MTSSVPVDAPRGAAVPRCNILGVSVSAIDMPRALGVIDGWLERRERSYVCVTGVHGVMESQRDPALRRIHNEAGLVTPDGMPLVWLSRLRGHANVDRVYGPDLLLALAEHTASRGCRHFFFGGAPGIPERLVENLKTRYPSLVVAGTFSPPFHSPSDDEDAAIIERINGARADIVWVGFGTPKQERWMATHRARLEAPVLLGVGAAFDFHAGAKVQAPRWIQRSGFEWLFRLLTEPRRLWKRYLVNNPQFLFFTLLQLLRLKRYEIEGTPRCW